MKPDWSTAPEWARFLAMDANGAWYWYEERPRDGDETWMWVAGKISIAVGYGTPWYETLEEKQNG